MAKVTNREQKKQSHNFIPILQITIIILLGFLNITSASKILFFLGPGSYSHFVAIEPLASKLSEKGHDITIFSPLTIGGEYPKLKQFCPQSLLDLNKKAHKDLGNNLVKTRLEKRNYDPFSENFGALTWEFCYKANKVTLNGSELRGWIENSKFDLVITAHPGREVGLGIAHQNRAKVIAFSASPLWPTDSDMFGIPTESSWYPGWTVGNPYSFIPDKFYQEWNAIGWYLNYKWNYLPKMDSLLKDFFGSDIPHIEDLIKNINIFLLNTHFSNEFSRSFPPFIVPVGGIHVKETSNPLPKNIDDFIKSGSDGFIYISFGSLFQISGLPHETQKGFFDAIRSFQNVRFLIKWNDEIPVDMPNNVLPMKWLPQQDLLAHPNCRGFVSQGGLMSYQQATYHGVPMVIMPVVGDQPYNAFSAEHQGIGIYLELADLSLDTFSDALGQLLHNEKLSNRAKEVARRFKDRPMSPVDTAVWWTEYVLRHTDTSHLKPLGISQEWWQRRLLDFWAIVFTVMLLLIYVLMWAVCSLIRVCRSCIRKSREKVKRS